MNEQLNEALNSRIVIEQAKGVIAERAGIDTDEAFQRLRHHARSNNLRLADVARDVAERNAGTSTTFGGARTRRTRPTTTVTERATPHRRANGCTTNRRLIGRYDCLLQTELRPVPAASAC